MWGFGVLGGGGERFPGVSRREGWVAGSGPAPPSQVFQLPRKAPRDLLPPLGAQLPGPRS